jgi:hypothetical protein
MSNSIKSKKLSPKDFKDNCKRHYSSLTIVYCPALQSHVNFSSDGFYHMIFSSNRRRRNVSEQYSRLALIPLIKPVLKNAKKIDEARIEENKKLRGEKIETCFALVENVGKRNVRVKVIVRKTGNGKFYFHSVMRA